MRLRRFESFNILKLPTYAVWLARLFFLARDPFGILRHYAAKTSPSRIELRNGLTLILSDQPHDVITFIVVFVKRDYGNIAKGSQIIDVGANIGMFAVYAAQEGAGRIFCFEPNRDAFRTLEKNIAFNKLEKIVTPLNLAVAGTSGQTVAIPKASSPYNHTVAATAIDAAADGYDMVETVSLADFMRDQGLRRVDLLKMDCEGAEYDIFPNLAPETIAAIRSIRMEVHGDMRQLLDSLQVNPFKLEHTDANGDLWMTNRTPA